MEMLSVRGRLVRHLADRNTRSGYLVGSRALSVSTVLLGMVGALRAIGWHPGSTSLGHALGEM